jgi:hypothetical protein
MLGNGLRYLRLAKPGAIVRHSIAVVKSILLNRLTQRNVMQAHKIHIVL